MTTSHCHLLIIFANSWTPIRPEQNVGPDLGPNRLQKLSADDMSGKVLMQKVKYNGLDPNCQNLEKHFFLFDSLRPINNISVI